MTVRDGRGECDACGRDIGNAGVDQAVIVATVSDTGEPLTLHLCRQPYTAEQIAAAGGVLFPCAATVVNAETFAAYAESGRDLPTFDGTE